MNRLVIVGTAFLVIGYAIGRVSTQLAVNAEGHGAQEPCATTSSDANGDGGTNLTDAVYTLNSLFLGGPAPVPLCPGTAGKGLPATGQKECYVQVGGQGWVTVPCDSADYPGQDGFYQAGCPSEGRFADNVDGTVTDTCTGLEWQKDTADVSGDGSIDPNDVSADRLEWQEALQYCDRLSFAGHADWRLPNERELLSIVDYGCFDPAIDPVFGAVSFYYWSSSTMAKGSGVAWSVGFRGGSGGSAFKDSRAYVRAVRGGL